MQLIDAIVRNPVKVTVGVLLVALFGAVSLLAMPMQLTPEVQIPTLTIETRWPGASPQEVEQEIILEQEEFLKSVEGVTKMTSESSDSQGRIILEFQVGSNMDEALLKVNSRLQQVPEYPEDADQPVISTSNASDRPIAWFSISPRPPDEETLATFAEEHPELREAIERVRRTENSALKLLYLRELAVDHPEVKPLLPPDDIDVTKLRRFAEDVIEARFERVPGVSNSNIIGGLTDELQVVVDPQKLAARQLTIADVRNVLRGQNADVSAGDVWEAKRRYVVRTLGQFRSPEQVEMQLLAVRDGQPVYIRDVGEVRLGYKKPDSVARRFGGSAIFANALRETGANVLDVMQGLREATAELNETWLKPRNLELKQVYDETDYIYSAVGLVQENIIVGGALTMIVLMLFLHLNVRTLLAIPLIAATALAAVYLSPWYFVATLAVILGAGFWFARGALVVGLAIPTSIIGTFLIMAMLGRSLNVISLAGLSFAVGMLVDNAIVVLENIYTHYSRGAKPLAAAVRGTQEVWGAVLASTLTTVAVFVPVVFVQEEAGQLFRDIALAISAAVGLSLIVSMTLIPMISARLLTGRREEAPTEAGDSHAASNGHGQPSAATQHAPARRSAAARVAGAIVAPLNALGSGFITAVVAVNNWTLRGTVRRLAVTLAMVAASAGVVYALWPKVEYLPNGNRNLVIGLLLPPPGYNIDKLAEMGQVVEDGLRPYWDVDPHSPAARELKYPIIDDFFFVARGRQVFLGLRSRDPARVAELIPLIQSIGAQLEGTITVAFQTSLFEQGLAAGRSIDIEITGPELPELVAIGREVFGRFIGPPEGQLIPGAQARPVPSLDLSSPEIHVRPKLLQAAQMGVDSATLGYSVNALVDGAYAGDYIVGGKKIDLTIVGDAGFIDGTQDVKALPIATPLTAMPMPLEALAEVTIDSGPEQVNHRERVRAITIQVSPPEGFPLEEAMERIENEIVAPMRESGRLEGGYMINLAGTADKLRSTWEALRFNVILALTITYLLMAALFESWLYPFVIILTVPLGAAGGLMGLAALNVFLPVPQSLDVLTMLGFVILVGTVVNNPILIVHQSLIHMREDGMRPREAILEATGSRIRPIFMTTITTVLGLLPLVLFPGAGSELYRGLGAVFLGGLLLSTFFTLWLVPTVFSLTMDAKAGLARLLGLSTEETRREQAHAEAVPGPDGAADRYELDDEEPVTETHEFADGTVTIEPQPSSTTSRDDR